MCIELYEKTQLYCGSKDYETQIHVFCYRIRIRHVLDINHVRGAHATYPSLISFFILHTYRICEGYAVDMIYIEKPPSLLEKIKK